VRPLGSAQRAAVQLVGATCGVPAINMNARYCIHRVKAVEDFLSEIGVTVMLLPAYSPELNPIELSWAWIKKLVRDQPARALDALDRLVCDLWGRLNVQLCSSWVRHAGYRQST
jgi:transposase